MRPEVAGQGTGQGVHRRARWSGVRDATQFGANCPQPASPFGIASTSENCLYLNVFAPAGRQQSGAGRPVMVWIHGGGLRIGESNDYDPAKLVADGTLVVTINFREGALGFLAHPALAGRPGGSSGNYGLMDQQAALRWVQRILASSAVTRGTSRSRASLPAACRCWPSSPPPARTGCSPRPSWRAAPLP